MSGGDSRLARWSQRKQAARLARRGGAAPRPLDDATATPEPDPLTVAHADDGQSAPDVRASSIDPVSDVQPETAQSPVVEDAAADLPAIEDLDAESDYAAFMRDGVPEALKRAALSKLWRSDAVFANLDGLNDYDLDYNALDRLIAAGATDYKVGRGFVDERPAPPPADPEKTTAAEDGHEDEEQPETGGQADGGAESDAPDDVAGETDAVGSDPSTDNT